MLAIREEAGMGDIPSLVQRNVGIRGDTIWIRMIDSDYNIIWIMAILLNVLNSRHIPDEKSTVSRNGR